MNEHTEALDMLHTCWWCKPTAFELFDWGVANERLTSCALLERGPVNCTDFCAGVNVGALSAC